MMRTPEQRLAAARDFLATAPDDGEIDEESGFLWSDLAWLIEQVS